MPVARSACSVLSTGRPAPTVACRHTLAGLHAVPGRSVCALLHAVGRAQRLQRAQPRQARAHRRLPAHPGRVTCSAWTQCLRLAPRGRRSRAAPAACSAPAGPRPPSPAGTLWQVNCTLLLHANAICAQRLQRAQHRQARAHRRLPAHPGRVTCSAWMRCVRFAPCTFRHAPLLPLGSTMCIGTENQGR